MKKEAEERILHRMAKVHDILEMWQGSQNLRATQKESRAQTKQMTAVGYILDTEDIVKPSWSLFQHDGAAAFKLSQRSPLPPALSAKDLHGEWTQILNIHCIRRITRHPVENDEDSAPESISDTEDWLNWNGDLHNPNDSKEDWAADDDPNIKQKNCMRMRNAQSSRMWAPCHMCPDWFGRHGSQKVRLKMFWWQSMQLKRGEIKDGRKSRTECVNGSPALCSLTESFS